jgi:2',3'-cyclic-nucleotide 2'-phosphodiesterase (5'-nucleotidase family)
MTLLTVLHTNDIHARVDQLARIATLARQIRAEVTAGGGACLLVDAGDVEDPTLPESNITKGAALYSLLRAAGYDLAALGNATPIRYGPQAVPALAGRFGQPLLSANLPDPATGTLVAGTEPYRLVDVGGTPVAFIGLTAPMDAYAFFKLKPLAPAEVMPGLLAEARARGARAVIVLSHLGARDDRELAASVPGIDLIIGGHSHTEIYPPETVGGALIVQAGDRGRFLGRLDLSIDSRAPGLTLLSAELIPVTETIPRDPAVLAALEAERRLAADLNGHVVGELSHPVDLAEDRECAAGNLLADALLDRVPGAQIALITSGHWRDGLPAGPVTRGQVQVALPSTGNPARAVLTGRQILSWLQASLRPGATAKRWHPRIEVLVGMPHVAGASVRYDAASGDLREVLVDGRRLDPEAGYVVASSDLEFSTMVGYLVLGFEEVEYEVPTILPEVVEEYLARRVPLAPPPGGRLRAVVEENRR